MTPEELRELARAQRGSRTVGKVAGAAHAWMSAGMLLLALGALGLLVAVVAALFSITVGVLIGLPAVVLTAVGWKMFTTFT